MALQIEQLFNHQRFQDRAPVLFLLLAIYFPVGVVLLILRLLMSFQYMLVLAVLPKRWFIRAFLLRIYLFFMGLLVTTEGMDHKKGNAKIVVSNHISYMDSIAIESVFPTKRLDNQMNIPSPLRWVLGFINYDISLEELQTTDGDFPLSFFPENETTHGKCGLFKFCKSMLKNKNVGLVVQPLVLFSSRPCFFPVNVHYLYSSCWSDLLWTLFFPCTKFHICFLNEREIPTEKEVEGFITELEKDMASSLSIEPTSYTAQDKKEYIKRLAHEEKVKQKQVSGNMTRELIKKNKHMAKQVKIVLPQVPMNIIEIDINKSKNVDTTISNFLDGSVKYKPLTMKEQEIEREESTTRETIRKSKIVKISPLTSFNSNDEHLSFQEKKELMLEEARKRYLELHPEFI